MLIPKLQKFQPDLLFISAGFDAHVDDFYHYLTESDIHWVTEELSKIVHSHEHGIGVISILEGGYSLSTPIVGKAGKQDAAHSKFAQLPGDGGLVKG